MATYGTDFDEFAAGDTSTNLTGFTVQSTANTTSALVDAGSGDIILRHTLTSNGVAQVVYDAFSTTGDVECVVKLTLATTADLNAPVGPALVASDNQAYAWRPVSSTTWRLGLFNAAGANSTSLGAGAISFTEPTAGTPFWILVGRTGTTIYGSLWLDGESRPGSPLLTGTNSTLTTVKPGMYSFDSSDDPYDFSWFGAATGGDTAPEADPPVGGGGSNPNKLIGLFGGKLVGKAA